jgi:hypothetical protein
MRPWPREAWLVPLALLLGGGAFVLLGDGPGSQAGAHQGGGGWSLPAAPSRELAGPDGVWASRAPWGRPEAERTEAAPPPPPWRPVGVVANGRTFRAVFVTPGNPETVAGAGDKLPDGGRVLAVSRFHVTWTDGQGNKREQELLADPLPRQNTTP